MLFYLLLCFAAHAQAQNNGLTVNTTQGLIQGANALDGNYFTFYGIHYGGSTSGVNRFKAPSPAPKYPGVFHAVDSGVICAQPSPRGFIGVENCLTLNIFTQGSSAHRPVVVWLNGEEYATSDPTTYTYKGLVEEGLVVVQVNYRLSIFGFLCLRVPEAPGNAGLKDIIQALEWIKDNIAEFGGDPDNVILLGHGSAAAMVDLITLSPRSANLTHKAIALSGSGLAPWAIAYDPIGYAKAVGDSLEYSNKEPNELAITLAVTGTDILVNSINDFKSKNNTPLFAPCIEDARLNGSVITDDPLKIIRSGNFNHIPYIAGYTDREGSLRAEQAAYANWLQQMNESFTDFLQVDLELKSYEVKSNISKSIREFYFGNRAIDMSTIEDFLDYQGDTLILVSVVRGAFERALKSSAGVRLFEFGYRGSRSEWPYQTIPLKGVKHGGMLNYIFNFQLNAADEPVSKSLVTRIRNFAVSGAPTAEGSNTTPWNPISQDNFFYLDCKGGNIDGIATSYTEQIRTNPHQQRMTFWNDIYSRYHKAHVQVSSVDRVLCAGFVVMLCQLFITMF